MLQSKKVGVIVEVDGSISKVGMYNETNEIGRASCRETV